MALYVVDKDRCIIGRFAPAGDGYKFIELTIAGEPRTSVGKTPRDALPDWAKDVSFLEATDLLHAHDLLNKQQLEGVHPAAGSVK
jgi:hypothetical protein